jgi:hypothetical protein
VQHSHSDAALCNGCRLTGRVPCLPAGSTCSLIRSPCSLMMCWAVYSRGCYLPPPLTFQAHYKNSHPSGKNRIATTIYM